MRYGLLRWFNTISIFFILFLNSIYYSEIGGPESYYRKFLLLNGFVFLIANGRFTRSLLYAFTIPIFLVIISLLFNLKTTNAGAINSTLYTVLGLLLLALKPVIIDKVLMYRLIVYGLVVSLLLSLMSLFGSLNLLLIMEGYANFNINPNQAGIFFYTCITVTILFVRKWTRMLLIIPFYLMVLATGSRAAFICTTFLLLFSELLVLKKGNIEVLKKNIFEIGARFFALGLVFLSFIYLLQDYFVYLFERLQKVGVSTESVKGEGRDEIWKRVFELINQSPSAWIFGFGPSSIDSMLEKSTHNSFIDAIATKGLPFLFFTLVGIFFLMYFHYKRKNLIVVFSILNMLLYGYTVSDLFGGMGTLWGLIIFLSLWTRSLAKNELTLSNGKLSSIDN